MEDICDIALVCERVCVCVCLCISFDSNVSAFLGRSSFFGDPGQGQGQRLEADETCGRTRTSFTSSLN